MSTNNPLLSRWAAGETTFGVWGTIDSAFTAELIASESPDFFCADQQHGILDYQRLVGVFQAVRAAGSVPLSRVVSHDVGLIGKTLDAGAAGVIVPMVDDREQTERIVSAFHYQPDGYRSYGPVRASLTAASTEPAALSDVACIIMIETSKGLANVEEIASVPGVDALYVGPADLSLSLGLPPVFDSPEPVYRDALSTVLDACRAHGVTPGIQCTNGEMAKAYADLGFRLVTVASDANTLRAAIRRQLQAARGQSQTATAGGYS